MGKLTTSLVWLGGADDRRSSERRERCITARMVSSAALILSALVAAVLATPVVAFSGEVAATAAAKTVSVTCKGNAVACKAVVSVAGGASNRKLRIALSDTDLKLSGVVAKPSSIRGAYELSGGSYSLGGSLYTVTLNAVQAIPRGATLTFNFAVPARMMSCKSVTTGIAHLSVAKLGSKQAGGAYGCQQANAVGDTWMLRFNAREQVDSFEVNNVNYECKPAPTLPQNIQCDGGGTRVKFSGPTGH